MYRIEKRGTQQPSSVAAPRVVYYSAAESSLHTRIFQRTVPNFDFARYMNETGKPDLIDRLLDKEQAITIYKIVHGMDDPYKEVFLLRTLGELSFKEISNIFGKSESWAKVTFFRAKLKIIDKTEESI